MTSAAPVYRKLPGRGLAFAGIGRLWLAEDHLLEVESLLLHERYRRFFLPDIAALVVRRTKVRLVWNLVHGVLGFGGAALAGGLWWSGTFVKDQDPRVMLWVFAGMVAPFAVFFIVLFFINTLLGPTCRIHLQTTSAGWHPLAAPTRLRSARRLLARITPVIEAAQSAGHRPDMESTKSTKDTNENQPAEPVL